MSRPTPPTSNTPPPPRGPALTPPAPAPAPPTGPPAWDWYPDESGELSVVPGKLGHAGRFVLGMLVILCGIILLGWVAAQDEPTAVDRGNWPSTTVRATEPETVADAIVAKVEAMCEALVVIDAVNRDHGNRAWTIAHIRKARRDDPAVFSSLNKFTNAAIAHECRGVHGRVTGFLNIDSLEELNTL